PPKVVTAVPAGADVAAGAKVFASAGCGGCHTFAPAKSSGQAGPNLDRIRSSFAQVRAQVENGGGGMPAVKGQLSAAQIRDVAAAPADAARLTKADRAAIDRTLDVFVPAAIARHHPMRAYAVVTPQLRRQAPRAQWAKGNLPVSPYPAVGKRFHGWTIDALER